MEAASFTIIEYHTKAISEGGCPEDFNVSGRML